MHIEPCSIELNLLISKLIGYELIHLLNLGVPSAPCLKTFNWLQVTFNWYMQGKQIPPEVCKVLNLIIWYNCHFLIIFRATFVHDMI